MKKSTRIDIKLKRDTDKRFSSWNIEDTLSSINKSYYKLNLLDSIAKFLIEGGAEQNIILIDASFKTKNKYSYLRSSSVLKLSDEKDLKKFFYMGNPESMEPNLEIQKMNLLFKLFRKINSLMESNEVEAAKNLCLHNIYMNTSGEDSLDKLYLDAVSLIKESDIPKEKKENLEEQIFKISSDFKKKFEESIKDENKFNTIINSREDFMNSIESDTEKKDIEELLKKFYKLFHKLERPILGIYNSDLNEVTILNTSFMIRILKEDDYDETFLDIKSMSHNSPFMICLTAGMIIGLPLIALLKERIGQYKEEKVELSKINSKETCEEKMKELEESISKTEKYVEILGKSIGENTSNYHEIKNTHTRKNLLIAKERIVSGSKEVLVRNKFNEVTIDYDRLDDQSLPKQ